MKKSKKHKLVWSGSPYELASQAREFINCLSDHEHSTYKKTQTLINWCLKHHEKGTTKVSVIKKSSSYHTLSHHQ